MVVVAGVLFPGSPCGLPLAVEAGEEALEALKRGLEVASAFLEVMEEGTHRRSLLNAATAIGQEVLSDACVSSVGEERVAAAYFSLLAALQVIVAEDSVLPVM